MKYENVIIGFGPAGIGVALKLKNSIVLESSDRVGGLCKSYNYKSTTFDIGGHSFHTPHKEVVKLLQKNTKIFRQKRNAKCFLNNQIIDYPFQKNFSQLKNKKIAIECKKGLSNAKPNKKNYLTFIESNFGKGISKYFMLPYNTKLWGKKLNRMSTTWTSERVADPNKKEKFQSSGGKRKPLQSDTKVGYPQNGGFQEFFVNLSRNVLSDVKYRQKIKQINLEKKNIILSNNKKIFFENLISTMPITEFLKLIKECPKKIIKKSKKLEHLSLLLIVAIIKGKVNSPIQRIYSSEKKYNPGKIALNHNSSNNLRKTKNHAIMGEISYGKNKQKPKNVKNDFFRFLKDTKIINNKKQILDFVIKDIKYSYPVPTHDKKNIIDDIKGWLKKYSVRTVGRFAEWDYINSDEALKRGLDIGNQISKK